MYEHIRECRRNHPTTQPVRWTCGPWTPWAPRTDGPDGPCNPSGPEPCGPEDLGTPGTNHLDDPTDPQTSLGPSEPSVPLSLEDLMDPPRGSCLRLHLPTPPAVSTTAASASPPRGPPNHVETPHSRLRGLRRTCTLGMPYHLAATSPRAQTVRHSPAHPAAPPDRGGPWDLGDPARRLTPPVPRVPSPPRYLEALAHPPHPVLLSGPRDPRDPPHPSSPVDPRDPAHPVVPEHPLDPEPPLDPGDPGNHLSNRTLRIDRLRCDHRTPVPAPTVGTSTKCRSKDSPDHHSTTACSTNEATVRAVASTEPSVVDVTDGHATDIHSDAVPGSLGTTGPLDTR